MSHYSVGMRLPVGARVYNEMKLTLPSLSANEGMARAAVAAFCVQADPAATVLADIKCAVSEAVTNCIVHAYRERRGEITVRARLLEGRILRIDIRDRGCGIEDLSRAREPLYTTDAEGERSGMGFTVMESFCDGVRVSSAAGKGTTVTLLKRMSEQTPIT